MATAGSFIEVIASLRRIWAGATATKAAYGGGLEEAAARGPWRHGLLCEGAERLWWLMAWSRLEQRRWWPAARFDGVLRRRQSSSDVIRAVSALSELFHRGCRRWSAAQFFGVVAFVRVGGIMGGGGSLRGGGRAYLPQTKF
jgi:hypothetical protein